MTWNYRILAHKEEDGMYFQIHEVYYNEAGIPNGYTNNFAGVGGDSLKDINWSLEKMKEATSEPILLADGFPNEYK